MNTYDFTTVSRMFSSEEAYHTLVDMISDLDLELKGAFVF